MVRRRRGLWGHRDFLVFWAGESVSLLGSQVSHLALPLTAVLLLGAGAEQMGLLAAAGTLPFLALGLLAGVWADRIRRRPLLVATNLAAAAMMGSIPLAALAGVLSMPFLYLVALGIGVVEVLGTAAYQAYIPSLVGRRRLVEANSRLEVSSSIAIVVGPGAAGVLIQLLSAPIAIALDAASFLVAALGLALIRRPEPPPAPAGRGHLVADIREGLGVVLGDARLRLIMLCGATHNFFLNGMLAAIYVLYMVELGLGPAEIGVVFAAAGPGVLLGALLAGRVARRLGIGPTIAHMQTLTGVSRFVVAGAAVLSPGLMLPTLIAGEFLIGFARPIFNVNQVSLRQTITPDRLLGRMNASIRFLMWTAAPVGAVVGGLLAGRLGLPTAVAIAALGGLVAAAWVYLPPVWRVRQAPPRPPAADRPAGPA